MPLGHGGRPRRGAAAERRREPVENEDVATFTATFAGGAVGTFSVSRVALGHANALGFELFAERGAATFDLDRAGEFGSSDGARRPADRRLPPVLVGPAHPYLTGGLPMDFPGVGYGQNDLFAFQARAFLEQVAGLDAACRRARRSSDGLHNLRCSPRSPTPPPPAAPTSAHLTVPTLPTPRGRDP